MGYGNNRAKHACTGEGGLNRLNSIIHNWKNDFDYKTFLVAGLSTTITLAYALINAILGVWHQSLWNGSISAYYLLLTIIRSSIIFTQDRAYKRANEDESEAIRKTFQRSSLALIAMNLTLIVPISLMVKLEKPAVMGLIPAIAMAAYTFYRVPLACINYVKGRKSMNPLTRELRAINLMDALLSIITMQNALVSVKDTSLSRNILAVTAISSAALLLVIITISVRNYVIGMRELRAETSVAPDEDAS